jgi:coenzyme Q-binding protein COQ10
MPKISLDEHLPYNLTQLETIIVDVKSYPEFLPWCQLVRIIQHDEDSLIADMAVSFKSFTETYRSKICLTKESITSSTIRVTGIDGPFKYLENTWKLTLDDSGCKIHFMVDFSFKSSILNKLASLFLEKATQKIISAFKSRAKFLYGDHI